MFPPLLLSEFPQPLLWDPHPFCLLFHLSDSYQPNLPPIFKYVFHRSYLTSILPSVFLNAISIWIFMRVLLFLFFERILFFIFFSIKDFHLFLNERIFHSFHCQFLLGSFLSLSLTVSLTMKPGLRHLVMVTFPFRECWRQKRLQRLWRHGQPIAEVLQLLKGGEFNSWCWYHDWLPTFS